MPSCKRSHTASCSRASGPACTPRSPPPSTAGTGEPAEAVRLVDAAMALVDPTAEPVREALLHQRRGLYLWWLERGREGVRDFERAVELIPPEPPSVERA